MQISLSCYDICFNIARLINKQPIITCTCHLQQPIRVSYKAIKYSSNQEAGVRSWSYFSPTTRGFLSLSPSLLGMLVLMLFLMLFPLQVWSFTVNIVNLFLRDHHFLQGTRNTAAKKFPTLAKLAMLGKREGFHIKTLKMYRFQCH